MHLVTGLLLTALLGRGKQGPRLPSFPGVLETAHVLPGRLRLRVPGVVARPEAAGELRRQLVRLEAVEAVEVSTVTGSVLLRFRPDRVEPELLLAAVIRLLGLEARVDAAPQSRLGHEIRELGESLNRAVHEQSGGLLDLWTALPLLLVVLGVRNLISRNGQLGWPLLWWAYLALFLPGQNRR